MSKAMAVPLIERLRNVPSDARYETHTDEPFPCSSFYAIGFMSHEAADEIQRLRQALRDIYEVYAGSVGVKKPLDEVADHLLGMVEEMKDIASEAMKENT